MTSQDHVPQSVEQTCEHRSPLRVSPSSGGRFEAIIFDMGSTLTEFENIAWPVLYTVSLNALRRRLVSMGKTPPPIGKLTERFFALLERRRELMRSAMREYRIGELIRSLLRSVSISTLNGELSRCVDAYYAPIRRQVTVYPESLDTLRCLRDQGYRIGLLSNTCFRVRDHREELIHFGLWPYFDETVFTSTGVYRKPHPAPFRCIAERLGVPPERCLYVGDRQREDVQGPQGVGMEAVLIRRPHRDYIDGLTRSAEITSLAQLTALLFD